VAIGSRARPAPRAGAQTTIVEVARSAGVTAATVSNVLRSRGKVADATRRRVLAAADALGYRPNLTARALVEGRPPTIAMIVSSIANPFYPEFALAVEQAVRRQGYFLLVCNTNDDPAQERAYVDAVAGSLAHGILVMNADFVQIDALVGLHNKGVPIVLCMWERPEEPPALPSVAIDFYQAGVTVVIALAAIYAQEVMKFDTLQTMMLIFVVNITAALGAFLFGYVQDRLGHRRTLALTLLGWLAMTWIAAGTTSVAMFWVAANLAGICMGSSQSAGRAMAGALAPEKRRAEFFGLWILATQIAAVIGPLTYGAVMIATGNDHRTSILVTGTFFLACLLLIAPINMQRGRRVAETAAAAAAEPTT